MDYSDSSKKLKKALKDIKGLQKEIRTFLETRGMVTGSYFNKEKKDKKDSFLGSFLRCVYFNRCHFDGAYDL